MPEHLYVWSSLLKICVLKFEWQAVQIYFMRFFLECKNVRGRALSDGRQPRVVLISESGVQVQPEDSQNYLCTTRKT